MTPIEELRRALSDHGPCPRRHVDTYRRHRQEWPVLWRAISRLLVEDDERQAAISRHPSSLHPLHPMPPAPASPPGYLRPRPSPYKSSEDYR